MGVYRRWKNTEWVPFAHEFNSNALLMIGTDIKLFGAPIFGAPRPQSTQAY